MFSTVTSPTNGPQTLLLPHDANERTSCPVIHVQHPRFPEASGLECEKEMQKIRNRALLTIHWRLRFRCSSLHPIQASRACIFQAGDVQSRHAISRSRFRTQ